MVMLITRSLWLLMYAYAFITFPVVKGQSPKKCANVDEYCLTHSDCCSKTCLTYLYRCTRSYNGIYPYTFFGEKNPAPGTLQDVVAFTSSNFGSVEEMQRHQQQHEHGNQQIHNHPIQQTPYGFHSRFNDEGIGGDQYLNDEDGGNQKTIVTTSAPLKADTNSTANTKANASETVQGCKEIGSKCYTHEDCCTKRCHAFLHQCVT